MRPITIILTLTLMLLVVGCGGDINIKEYSCQEVKDALYTGGCLPDGDIFSGRCFKAAAMAYYLESECDTK